MANSTNLTVPTSWTLAATGATGSIVNAGVYDFEMIERDGVPSDSLKGIIVTPKFGSTFNLTSGQSIYVRSLQDETVAVITLE